MEEANKILAQIKDLWSKLSARARLGASVALGLTALVIAAMVLTSSANYAVLYKLNDPAEAAEVAAALDGAKIPYKTSGGGTLIEVPRADVDRARMLLADQKLPSGGSVTFSSVYDDPDPGTTRETERVNFLRALQGELERTISSLDAVASARVHLSLPKKAVFRTEDTHPTASVVLDLRGRRLERRNVAAVQHMVAAGVERLEATDVVVVTTEGERLIGVGEGEAAGLDYKTQLQLELERKITRQLEQIVGIGGVQANVEAKIDFSQMSTHETTYDPEQIAIRSETTQETYEGQGGGQPQGLAGALANQPGANAAGMANGGAANTHKSTTRTYEVNKTVVETRSPSAQIRKLTVAVIVDGTHTIPEDGGAAVFNPRSAEEIARFQSLVENAVGYDSARGDRVLVTSSQFVARPNLDASSMPSANSTPSWLPYAIGGGVLGLVAVVFMMRKKRSSKQADAEVIQYPTRVDEAQRALDAAENNSARAALASVQQLAIEPELEQLREEVLSATEGDPERAAEVVKAWMHDRDAA